MVTFRCGFVRGQGKVVAEDFFFFFFVIVELRSNVDLVWPYKMGFLFHGGIFLLQAA